MDSEFDGDDRLGDPTGSDVRLHAGGLMPVAAAEYSEADHDSGILSSAWDVTLSDGMAAVVWEDGSVHGTDGEEIGWLQ